MMKPEEDRSAALLAHQLKSPASALLAASANLRRNMRALLEDLGSMAAETGQAGGAARFVARVISEGAPPPITGLLPEDRVVAIARRLRDTGIEIDHAAAAARLARGGWDTWIDDIVPLLRHDAALALEVLESASRLRANISSIDSSVARVKGLASALRHLSRPVSSDDSVPVDVAAQIESTARMLREHLASEVSLSLRLDPIPPVLAPADLLAEVWVNLIQNAAQALSGEGTIHVETSLPVEDPSRILVQVTDNGPGIPPDLAPRIFDPFVTTRSADGGTGLGLALALRVVEGLGGGITVVSRPGRTCFSVRLPALGVGRR